jgi:hypothetical protein
MRLLEHQLEVVQSEAASGERLFIALGSVTENPTAVPLACIADRVLLCVALGTTTKKAALRTIEAIGRERFLGTIVVDPREAA